MDLDVDYTDLSGDLPKIDSEGDTVLNFRDGWSDGEVDEAVQILLDDLEGLSNLSLLGLDLKIQPNGEVRMIEGHYAGFGTRGFDQIPLRYDQLNHRKSILGGELAERYLGMDLDEDLDKPQNLSGAIKYGIVKEQMHPGLQNGFERVFKSNFGRKNIGYQFFLPKELQEASELVKDQLGISLSFNEDISRLLNDKYTASKELAPFTPRTVELSNLNRSNSQQISQGDVTVFKAKHGSQGENVHMLPSDQVRGKTSEEFIDHFLEEDILERYTTEQLGQAYILQEFIPSKPIPHEHEVGDTVDIPDSLFGNDSIGLTEKETKEHDGCARYVCAVEEYENGIEVHPIHAYWRLAPEPLDSNSDNSVKANYSQGAIPAKISDEDLTRMDNAVEHHIPTIFQ